MEQVELFHYTVRHLESLAIPYMLVGSYASGIHGDSRQTRDIDIVLDLFPFQVDRFCEGFPPPDFYVSPDAVRDAIRTRFQFNVIDNTSGNKIDCIFTRGDEWSRSQLSRRQRVQITPVLQSFVASPVDVIVGKLWYFTEGQSDKHIRDIVSILKTSGQSFDPDDVTRWALKLGYHSAWERCLEEFRKSEMAKG